MRMATLLFIFFLSITYMGCGPYEGPVLNSNDPMRLQSCPTPVSDDRAMLSFDTLIATLEHNGWFIAVKAPETKIIDARKCKDKRFSKSKGRHPMQRKQSDCLDLRFTISSSGAVTLDNPPERRFYWKIEPSVHDWLEALERDYSHVRCFNAQDIAYWRQTSQ